MTKLHGMIFQIFETDKVLRNVCGMFSARVETLVKNVNLKVTYTRHNTIFEPV